MTEHRLSDLRFGPSLSGSNEWRGWVCTCGSVGSGYRFPDTVAVVNEWAEHLLAASADATPRVLREEIRHGALMEATAALRAIATSRQPPAWSANESLAWKEAANYVEDMATATASSTSD